MGLARQCASAGELDKALAHTLVVNPAHLIRVRVDCPLPPAQQGIYRNAVAGAFYMWEDAMGAKLFRITETATPDVVIHFQPDVVNRGSEVAGHIDWKRGVTPAGDPILSATIQIRMQRGNGVPMSFEQLRGCLSHELGHVLGLSDSDSVGDVMGAMNFANPAEAIRPEEVANLISLRNEALSLRVSLAARKQAK